MNTHNTGCGDSTIDNIEAENTKSSEVIELSDSCLISPLVFQFPEETRNRIIRETIQTQIAIKYKASKFSIVEYYLHFGFVISASYRFILNCSGLSNFQVERLPSQPHCTTPSLVSTSGPKIKLAKDGIFDFAGNPVKIQKKKSIKKRGDSKGKSKGEKKTENREKESNSTSESFDFMQLFDFD